jgi:uncharacterized protein
MIIDVHTHIFPKSISESRSDYFEGEPSFKLLYESPKSKMADAETLIESMDQSGVDVSVVFGFPWKTPDIYRKHNDYILNSVAKCPKRLIGLCCVDMFEKGALDEIKRCLDAGLSGVGEIAFYQSGIGPDALELLRPVMDICKTRDLPVLIHTNEPIGHVYPGKTPVTLAQIYSVLETFPENKVILAHWGGGIFFYCLMKKQVRQMMKNVFFDTAASPFLYDPKIYRIAIETAGAEKILLGTDFPLIKPDRYFKEMEAVGLTESEKSLICGGNATTLFNL